MTPALKTGAAELERLITMKTAECEGVVPVGEHFGGVRVVRVLSVEPLPGSRNKRVTVDAGEFGAHVVVCGAPNVAPGMLTAWVRPGTRLGGQLIEKAKIDGVTSDGMLASADELGINRDHAGVIVLEELRPGEALPALEPDWVIEIDNKSLTHRPDLWGHVGMAREVAAITGVALHDPVRPLKTAGKPARVAIEIIDRDRCSRFSALLLDNVTVAPSPFWLQARLEAIGLNPINNIVDVTNYVMAELPQPMHAYDADKLSGDTIFVRRARAGESIEALNGETYVLSDSDLVIADSAGAIAIAGVIGGQATAIGPSTRRIVLESANFDPTSVRLTSARLKLRTDASMRFEKSLDPRNTVRGIARAAEMLAQTCPHATMASELADQFFERTAPPPIAITAEFISEKLGKAVARYQVTSILEALGFAVGREADEQLRVAVPSWRGTKDITSKYDLVEEIGRMIGYGEIEPVAPHVAATVPPPNPLRKYVRQVRHQMADQSYTEVYNYSFVNAADLARFGFREEDHLAIANPIAAELTHLRRSLLPGIFRNIISNTRHFTDFRLFEIGREIHPGADAAAPEEHTRLIAANYQEHGDEQEFFEAKRVVECVLPGARCTAPAAGRLSYEHPTRAAEIWWRGSQVGRLFELHPALLVAEGIEGRAVLFDVDLDRSLALTATPVEYRPVRRYPTSGFDISVLADRLLAVATLQDQLTELAGGDLASIEFVRQYAGPPLPENQKSVSYHLEVGSLARTLTSDEVVAIRGRVFDGMRRLGYELRDR